MSANNVYEHFYRVPRASAKLLSDGGGPFGFDITTALEVDYLIEAYGCDAIIETGSNLGDTTHYLSLAYPQLTIVTCDIVEDYIKVVRQRLRNSFNTVVEQADSRTIVEKYRNEFRFPLFFLDAHWYEDWPLEREMQLIERGVVCIDDFNIGHTRYGFDAYNGTECGPAMMQRFQELIPYYYTNNPEGSYPLPCLQTGRRGGKAFYQLGHDFDYFQYRGYFKRRDNS